jgi:hypothetical protein
MLAMSTNAFDLIDIPPGTCNPNIQGLFNPLLRGQILKIEGFTKTTWSSIYQTIIEQWISSKEFKYRSMKPLVVEVYVKWIGVGMIFGTTTGLLSDSFLADFTGIVPAMGGALGLALGAITGHSRIKRIGSRRRRT